MRGVAVILLLGVLVSCASNGPLSRRPVDLGPASLQLYSHPSGTVPVPVAFDEAEVAFERARTDYKARRYAAAADGFVASARLLRGVTGDYADAAVADRSVCYTNASHAFAAAKDVPGAKRALTEAAREDPACTEELHRLVAELE